MSTIVAVQGTTTSAKHTRLLIEDYVDGHPGVLLAPLDGPAAQVAQQIAEERNILAPDHTTIDLVLSSEDAVNIPLTTVPVLSLDHGLVPIPVLLDVLTDLSTDDQPLTKQSSETSETAAQIEVVPEPVPAPVVEDRLSSLLESLVDEVVVRVLARIKEQQCA